LLFLTARTYRLAHFRSEPPVAGQHIRRQAATLSEWFAQSAFFFGRDILYHASRSTVLGCFDDGLLAVLVYSRKRR
jgi:hypothetical protein